MASSVDSKIAARWPMYSSSFLISEGSSILNKPVFYLYPSVKVVLFFMVEKFENYVNFRS
jgi:hypothetical protein